MTNMEIANKVKEYFNETFGEYKDVAPYAIVKGSKGFFVLVGDINEKKPLIGPGMFFIDNMERVVQVLPESENGDLYDELANLMEDENNIEYLDYNEEPKAMELFGV